VARIVVVVMLKASKVLKARDAKPERAAPAANTNDPRTPTE
jgi:hypothetical protein